MNISKLFRVSFSFIAMLSITFVGDSVSADDLLDLATESAFSAPPNSIDITLRRNLKYEVPSENAINNEVDRELHALQLNRALRNVKEVPDSISRELLEKEVRQKHAELADRWIRSRWQINSQGHARVTTVIEPGSNPPDYAAGEESYKTLYVRPAPGVETDLVHKIADFGAKRMREGTGSSVAFDDMRLYGRATHPMMPTLTAMIQGTFKADNNTPSLSQSKATEVLAEVKSAFRGAASATRDQLDGKEVIRVDISGGSQRLWLDMNNPDICYRKEAYNNGVLISQQIYSGFVEIEARLMYPSKTEIFKILSDGRELREVVEVESVELNQPIRDEDIDWSAPDGWTVIDHRTNSMYLIEGGARKLVKKGSPNGDGSVHFSAALAGVDDVLANGIEGIDRFDNDASGQEALQQDPSGHSHQSIPANSKPNHSPLTIIYVGFAAVIVITLILGSIFRNQSKAYRKYVFLCTSLCLIYISYTSLHVGPTVRILSWVATLLFIATTVYEFSRRKGR